jgi:selenocysteine lyase/cysteine desulfurase
MQKTATALKRAKVDVSLSPGRMRISPSVYNDATDIQKLLTALS